MPDDPRVQELLDRLSDSDATPEEVCGSCAELLPVVRDRWRQMCRAREQLDALFPPEGGPGSGQAADNSGAVPLPVVPGYEVEAELGHGGMGIVYRARHVRLNRLVALKMVLADGHAGPRERARFRQEAEAVAALRHPNIVQVHDVGDVAGRPYFTMEYVEGGSLAQKLAGTPLPGREAAAVVATLAGAVEAAHRGGIVHRDLKPANVLLTADGVPKVSDFGLARRLGGDAGLTGSGTAVGTPSYMAPEQASGQAGAAGPAADVYSLGAILYELLTGRPPFKAETAAETVHQLLSQDPVAPSRLNARVPRDLETVCLKCLAREPRRRYPTAAALGDDLGRVLRGEATAARPEGPLAQLVRRVRRRPFPAAAGAVAVLATAALVGFGAWTLSERAAARQAAAADREAVERAAGDDLTEMENLLRRSAWPEARAALERAKGRLGDRDSAGLRQRLNQGARDLELVTDLEEIRLRLSRNSSTALSPETLYADAYRKYGIDLLTLDPAEAATRISNSAVRETLLAFLHDWLYWVSDANRARVRAAVDRADDDRWRQTYRDAIAAGDRDPGKLKALAAAPEAVAQHPVILSGLCGSLLIHNLRAEASAVLNAAQQRHPDDFWINYLLGQFWSQDRPLQAAGYFRAAVALRPSSDQAYYRLGRALRDTGDVDGAIDAFRQTVALNSEMAVVKDLAKLLAPRGGLDEVRVAWQKHLDGSPPDHESWYGYAQLCLFLGDEEAFGRNRAAMLDRFGGAATEWYEAERTSLACLLRPTGGDELRRIVEMVDRAAAVGPQPPHPDHAYIQFVRGFAEYRRGRPVQAIPLLEESAARLTNRPGPRLVLAMAQFKAGSPTEARKTLVAAVRAYDWREMQVDQPTIWVSHVLRREAEGLILPNFSAFLEGKYRPKDSDERLAFVGVCELTKHALAAARLWADAFGADPRLAEDLGAGHRYDAARAAAAAGCGRSVDAASLREPDRARWRAQAREWLRSDLAAWGKALDGDAATTGKSLKQVLANWRGDPYLAGLREAAELDKLPAVERKECSALWEDIAVLLDRAAAAR
jgi:serine/threonine-protein kinase